MRHQLAKIKMEMAALYAAVHPETKLEDIGEVLGWAKGSANSMVGEALQRYGTPRKRGAGSPAYDKAALWGGEQNHKHDHDLIARWIRENPTMSYREIGQNCGCSVEVVGYVAHHRLNFWRGIKRPRKGPSE